MAEPTTGHSEVKIGNISVSGRADLVEKVAQALSLLEEKSPQDYEFAQKNLLRIPITSEGSHADSVRRLFNIKEETAIISPIPWLASIIAHDAMHVFLFWSNPVEKIPRTPRELDDSERTCLKYQIDVGKKIGLDSRNMASLKSSMKNPRYWDLNKDGRRDSLDIKLQKH